MREREQSAGPEGVWRPKTLFALLFALMQTAAVSAQIVAVTTDEDALSTAHLISTDTLASHSFFTPFDKYTEGTRVALADFNGDGWPDIVTGTAGNTPALVRVFDGMQPFAEIESFFPYVEAFTGGVFVAAGDVTGDGTPDLITGADAGGGPHVKVFDGTDFGEVRSFFAYNAQFLGGVRVAAGDVDGDGFDDVITAPGAGGASQVSVFSGDDLGLLASFFAYDLNLVGGTWVAGGDVDGDGLSEIITGTGNSTEVRVFSVDDTSEPLFSFDADTEPTEGGIRVAAGEIQKRGRAQILTAQADGVSFVKLWQVSGGTPVHLDTFQAFLTSYEGGVFIAAQPEYPPTLLVDDDNNDPDTRATWEAALESLDEPWDVWDTENSDNEPGEHVLAHYERVLWSTAGNFLQTTGPGAAAESDLGAWLDRRGCLLISGQDYRLARGQTTFMETHLGVVAGNESIAHATASGAGDVFGGLGPYALSYPKGVDNFSDTFILAPDATQAAFVDPDEGMTTMAASKGGGVYLTSFFGFPWEAIPTAEDREAVLEAFFTACQPIITRLSFSSGFETGD